MSEYMKIINKKIVLVSLVGNVNKQTIFQYLYRQK
jgi:hypothetical protein